MSVTRYSRLAMGFAVGVGVLLVAGAAVSPVRDASPAVSASIAVSASPGTEYVLSPESIFAEGCLGSEAGKQGCMCPLLAALEFTGSFTLTPNHHTPPGHRAYDVTVADWFFSFAGEENEVTGTGYYDRWTDSQGDRWHIMTLDLVIYGEEVHLSTGILEDLEPGDDLPPTLDLALESDTECFGYFIVLYAAQ
ncbi:MAG: hypothetical protein PVJ57_16355 [Phycisphaerae bacterium]